MISYIIVSYNTCQYTIQTVESIMKNCNHYEIIVIDNNSTDNTVQELQALNNSNLVIIRSKVNLGFSKANNLGAKSAKGDFFVFINPDTLVLSDVGNELYELYKTSFVGTKTILSPQIINADYTLQHCNNLFPVISVKTPFKYLKKRLDNNRDLIKCDWITGVCLSMPRNVFVELNGWNEIYDLYAEDLDICYRAHLKGGECCIVKNIKIIHYGNQSGKQVYKTNYESFKKKNSSLRKYFDAYYSDRYFYLYMKIQAWLFRNKNAKRYLVEEFRGY